MIESGSRELLAAGSAAGAGASLAAWRSRSAMTGGGSNGCVSISASA